MTRCLHARRRKRRPPPRSGTPLDPLNTSLHTNTSPSQPPTRSNNSLDPHDCRFRQLHQTHPRPLGHRLAQTTRPPQMPQHPARQSRLARPGRTSDRLADLQLTLSLCIECPDRLDLVTKELQPDRIHRIRSKNVDDPAMTTEFPWQRHCRRRLKTARYQPRSIDSSGIMSPPQSQT